MNTGIMSKTFLIYRHGVHPQNQPEHETRPIAIVTATDAETAKLYAAQLDTVFESQYLSAVPEEDADEDDWLLVSPTAVID